MLWQIKLNIGENKQMINKLEKANAEEVATLFSGKYGFTCAMRYIARKDINKKDLPAPTDKPNTNQNKKSNPNNNIPQKQDNDTRKSKKNNFGNNYQNKNKNGIKCVNDTFKNYKADELEKKLLQSQKGKFEDRIKIPIVKEKEDITDNYWNMN